MKNNKLIIFLIKNGARLDIKNGKNKFPIDIAVENNDWETVEFIVKISNLKNKNQLLRKNIKKMKNASVSESDNNSEEIGNFYNKNNLLSLNNKMNMEYKLNKNPLNLNKVSGYLPSKIQDPTNGLNVPAIEANDFSFLSIDQIGERSIRESNNISFAKEINFKNKNYKAILENKYYKKPDYNHLKSNLKRNYNFDNTDAINFLENPNEIIKKNTKEISDIDNFNLNEQMKYTNLNQYKFHSNQRHDSICSNSSENGKHFKNKIEAGKRDKLSFNKDDEENIEVFYSLSDEKDADASLYKSEIINEKINKNDIDSKIKTVFKYDEKKNVEDKKFAEEEFYFKNEIRERLNPNKFCNNDYNFNNNTRKNINVSKFDNETEITKSIMLRPEKSFFQSKNIYQNIDNIFDNKFDGNKNPYSKGQKLKDKLIEKDGRLYLIKRNSKYIDRGNKEYKKFSQVDEKQGVSNNDDYTNYLTEKFKKITDFSSDSYVKLKDVFCRSLKV